MTDQYTPDTERIKDDYRRSRVWESGNGSEAYKKEFDRWLASIVAAAEQRGTVKALREAATIIRDSKFANSVKPPSKKVQVKEADWLDALADRLECDDG